MYRHVHPNLDFFDTMPLIMILKATMTRNTVMERELL